MKYTIEYPEKLLKLMAKGLSNLEIAAELDISESEFYRWRDVYSEFKEAYDIGNPKRFRYLMLKADECYLTNDKGYKYFKDKIRYIYRDYAPEKIESQTTNNYQIGNMNVLNTKSESELLAMLSRKNALIEQQRPDKNDSDESQERRIDSSDSSS